MAVFPKKTPDEIVVGICLILAGKFFDPIFEFSPVYLKIAPKIGMLLGILLVIWGVVQLFLKKQAEGKDR